MNHYTYCLIQMYVKTSVCSKTLFCCFGNKSSLHTVAKIHQP